MRIEKIELIGFKSFADRTTFVLHPGITCIVGPNGCGKSNIVDAFRWVLGEQSAKSLRGEKMEEVIFNGSSLKKPKGMAEVTMVVSGFNGGGQGGNGGHAETATISRRLYRSGESEYMVNRTPCRLKDIRDIFLDTGLDFRSYSILEQGRIGEILNSKPLDRRFIIEEVAGVMKYKVRKAEALSKLESSRANLVRINDIILEVKKQINILDRLARKAERYKKLSSEMHAIELKIARREFEQVKEEHGKIAEEHASLKEEEAVKGARISETENQTDSRRLVLIEKEKELEFLQNDFQALERDISEIERRIAVAKADIGSLGEYLKKLEYRQQEAEARNDETTARIGELGTAEEKISGDIENGQEALREKTEAFRALEAELAEEEGRIEEKRKEVFRISEELSGMRNDLSRQQSLVESLERRETTSVKESEETGESLGEIEAAMSSVESEILANSNELLLLEEKKAVLVSELSSGKEGLEELFRSLSDAREDLASHSSRLESLKEIVLDRPAGDLIPAEGLLGTLSDVIEVEAEYEKAVEGVLSEKAELLILRSQEYIRDAIEALKRAEAGKTSFISLSPAPAEAAAACPSGAVGPALDFVRVREGYSRIAENVLGRVFIVRDIDAAFAMTGMNGDTVLVTLEGEVMEPSGAVVVGGGKGIFRRKREIRELEETIASERDAIEAMKGRVQEMQNLILEKEEEIKAVESSIHKIEKEVSLLRLTVDNYSNDKERFNRKLSYLALELEEISREKESLQKTIADNGDKIAAVETAKNALEDEAASVRDGIASKKTELEERRSDVTDLRLLIASYRERMEAIRNERDSLTRAVEEFKQKKADLHAEHGDVVLRITRRETEVTEEEMRLRKCVADADRQRGEISQRKEEIERENGDLILVEQGLRTLRQEIAAMRSRLSELDVARAEHRMRMDNIAGSVRVNYGKEVGELPLEEIEPEEEERLSELRRKIQEMGPVNLGTLEEYEELRGRYEFMTKQQDDLTKSIAELEEAISKINSTTRKKLRDAYEALNTKFGEVFTNLFGGGRAGLVLTDEHNILESGIEIVAQPPGKKLQNLHLLSGGEKALTALAIQFASFLIKPTPLCVLDEADAPLDESNTERYSKMLEELSQSTQFIVITHNRTTMGSAQHLYGITMEEAGVSKVISMQLEEVEA
ncbi:MAG: chromosome segregation protein SMC [Candidatus Sulfobium sp.]